MAHISKISYRKNIEIAPYQHEHVEMEMLVDKSEQEDLAKLTRALKRKVHIALKLAPIE